MLIRPLAIVLALFAAVPAMAETVDHSGHSMPAPDAAASTAAFMTANAKMHADMAITYTGNADVDFIRGMIAHHQGAVDAARIALEFGTDPDVRAFAKGVIDAQEAEIAWMQNWLAKNGE